MKRTPFEDDLAQRLSRLADRAPTTPGHRTTEPAVVGADPQPTRWRGRLVMAAAAAVGLVLGGLWLIDRPDPDDVLATDDDATGRSEELEAGRGWPTAEDSWSEIAAGPADGRGSPVQVWTGTELIIWGGETVPETRWADDGAAYDPTTDTWRGIAPSPLSARSAHVAVWSGTEMIVCCGRTPDDQGRAAAAYDPGVDTWRELATPPFDTWSGVAAWTGSEVIVTGGTDRQDAWAYSPAADEWRELAQPPIRFGGSSEAAWTGRRLIVWSGLSARSDRGAIYDPATDSWDPLPPLPDDLAIWGGSMVWAGDEVIVWGNSRADDNDAVGARLSLDAADWAPLADDPLEPFDWWNGVPGSTSAVWTGTEMLVWTGAMGEADGGTRTLAYDPADDAWRDVGTAPTTWFGPELLWTGDAVVAMTDPIVAIRPTATGPPVPPSTSGIIRGVLPNGDQYEISSTPALSDRVEGISAGIIIDLEDGQEPIEGPVVGIAQFERVDGTEVVGPSDDGRSVVVVAGAWRVHIAIYDHVVDELGPTTAAMVFDAIRPREIGLAASDLPAFDLAAPLRWATDDEIPLLMDVQYPEFIVQRGCGTVSVACSSGGELQVVPIGQVTSSSTPWNDNEVTIRLVGAGEPLDDQEPASTDPTTSSAEATDAVDAGPGGVVRHVAGERTVVSTEPSRIAFVSGDVVTYQLGTGEEAGEIVVWEAGEERRPFELGDRLFDAGPLGPTTALLISSTQGSGPEDFSVELALEPLDSSAERVVFDVEGGWENGVQRAVWDGQELVAALTSVELQVHAVGGPKIAAVPAPFDGPDSFGSLVWVGAELWVVDSAFGADFSPRLRIRRFDTSLQLLADDLVDLSGVELEGGFCDHAEWDRLAGELVCDESYGGPIRIDIETGLTRSIHDDERTVRTLQR